MMVKKSKIVNSKSSMGKAPQIICRQAGSNFSRKYCHEKSNAGFTKEYKIPWVEKVGWSRKYEDGWERIFGKKKAV